MKKSLLDGYLGMYVKVYLMEGAVEEGYLFCTNDPAFAGHPHISRKPGRYVMADRPDGRGPGSVVFCSSHVRRLETVGVVPPLPGEPGYGRLENGMWFGREVKR